MGLPGKQSNNWKGRLVYKWAWKACIPNRVNEANGPRGTASVPWFLRPLHGRNREAANGTDYDSLERVFSSALAITVVTLISPGYGVPILWPSKRLHQSLTTTATINATSTTGLTTTEKPSAKKDYKLVIYKLAVVCWEERNYLELPWRVQYMQFNRIERVLYGREVH